jgi:hypothetical protein
LRHVDYGRIVGSTRGRGACIRFADSPAAPSYRKGSVMDDLRAVGGAETDNVKRKQAWLDGHPGASVKPAGDWWVARDKAGILLQRRRDLGDLMDALEGQR